MTVLMSPSSPESGCEDPGSTDDSPHPLDTADSSSSGSAPQLFGHETDGAFSCFLLDTVKPVLTRILYIVIYDYNEKICNRCRTLHPSQQEHACLYRIPTWFLETHFEALKKRLWTDCFILTIIRLLDSYNVSAPEYIIQGVSKTILYELKPSKKNIDTITDFWDT